MNDSTPDVMRRWTGSDKGRQGGRVVCEVLRGATIDSQVELELIPTRRIPVAPLDANGMKHIGIQSFFL